MAWAIAAAVTILAISGGLIAFGGVAADDDHRLTYQYSPAEQAQRKLAIERRDASLLPVCTDDYFAWRAETKEEREALYGTRPPSLDFWERPGCRGIPDQEVQGPNRKRARPTQTAESISAD